MNSESHRRSPYLWLCAALSLYAAAFLTYSQTLAYAYDESYHLLAAQLIGQGKKPYIDFCFPQTPLNAYWNAAWMRILGQSWRVAHCFAALFTIAAVVLIAEFAFRRFPVPSWRFAAALLAGLATGLNAYVFEYASLAQPYGICLFAMVCAFRIAIRAVDRKGSMMPALTGFFAGAAAASSLLSAAAAPVLLCWMLFYNRAGSRWKKFIGFGIGGVIPFAPVIGLFWLGPQQTWFNVFRYHVYFRKLYWPETTQHDLEILTSWVDSGQGLVLGLLAVFGVLFIMRRSQWPGELKAEFYLCAWLAAGVGMVVGRAHPTFPQYFLLTTPFLAPLVVAGLYAIASRVLEPDLPWKPVLLVSALYLFGLGRSLYEDSKSFNWLEYQPLADKVEQVTPRNARVFADETIYFLTKRTPPSGLELSYSHKLPLPPAEAARLHILDEAAVKRLVLTGDFATAYSCDEDEIEDYGLMSRYGQHAEIADCTIFWDRKK